MKHYFLYTLLSMTIAITIGCAGGKVAKYERIVAEATRQMQQWTDQAAETMEEALVARKSGTSPFVVSDEYGPAILAFEQKVQQKIEELKALQKKGKITQEQQDNALNSLNLEETRNKMKMLDLLGVEFKRDED